MAVRLSFQMIYGGGAHPSRPVTCILLLIARYKLESWRCQSIFFQTWDCSCCIVEVFDLGTLRRVSCEHCIDGARWWYMLQIGDDLAIMDVGFSKKFEHF